MNLNRLERIIFHKEKPKKKKPASYKDSPQWKMIESNYGFKSLRDVERSVMLWSITDSLDQIAFLQRVKAREPQYRI